ncbi:TetR family transcriptional regulator [Nocardia sp. SYP-A9097]|uniref:TetR/AcrR family transcriptional regulator n=1 Tax=Nocardia sp. SYP-A9097 TaxID=2663237 RepID=UPI00129A397F|nr:TetR family transcriptional regulator [Nocardia sp. SYP-A9097]MRH92095.1 TetR family transcriptional regulator [Nocardia sp. SYP-A9097]
MTSETPRGKLLRAGQAMLEERGRISDLTLRKLAEQLGTSHRMLIHHFGSRDGYLAALLTEVRREEQESLRALDAKGTFRGAVEMMERLYLDPANHTRLAAMFYVTGLAVQDPAPYRDFLESLSDWTTLLSSLGEKEGMDGDAARAMADALVWSARGIIIVGITTGDLEASVRELHNVIRHLVPEPLWPDAIRTGHDSRHKA